MTYFTYHPVDTFVDECHITVMVLGARAPGPSLEDNTKRSGEDPLENGCDGQYGEERNKGRPAHCEVNSRII
jgi:hypothetical protein